MKCGHCKSDHKYTFEVRACNERNIAQAAREAAKYRNTPNSERKPTDNQLTYIQDLIKKKGMKGIRKPETFSAASRTIDYLKTQKDVANPERPGPVISFMATNIIKDGRYAVRTDEDNKQFAFVRVARPKTGRFRGTLVVQTQHGDDLVRRLVFNLTTKATLYQNNRAIAGQNLAEILSAIIVDPQGSAMAYASEKNVCFVCGKSLTDHRSTYMGIGPECEKTHQAYVAYVEDTKGPYRAS